MMLKRIISLFVLAMYLHGTSGYTMSFHKCNITGFEKVYTSFGNVDPCGDMENDCNDSKTHLLGGKCCDVQNTIINVDDRSNISTFKMSFQLAAVEYLFLVSSTQLTYQYNLTSSVSVLDSKRPPDLSSICVYRI